jgi:hypothetical protein
MDAFIIFVIRLLCPMKIPTSTLLFFQEIALSVCLAGLGASVDGINSEGQCHG